MLHSARPLRRWNIADDFIKAITVLNADDVFGRYYHFSRTVINCGIFARMIYAPCILCTYPRYRGAPKPRYASDRKAYTGIQPRVSRSHSMIIFTNSFAILSPIYLRWRIRRRVLAAPKARRIRDTPSRRSLPIG